MIRLHFLFGPDIQYDGPVEDVSAMDRLIREHLGLVGDDRYAIQLLRDEADPSVRYVLVEDRAVSHEPFFPRTLPCYLTQAIPRRTIWIDPPMTADGSPWETHYIEYYQFWNNDGTVHTVQYWKPFEMLEMHHPTLLAMARYEYLRSCYRGSGEQKEEGQEREQEEQKEWEEQEWEQEQEQEWEQEQEQEWEQEQEQEREQEKGKRSHTE
jgi:hypothetical protein